MKIKCDKKDIKECEQCHFLDYCEEAEKTNKDFLEFKRDYEKFQKLCKKFLSPIINIKNNFINLNSLNTAFSFEKVQLSRLFKNAKK